MAEQKTKKALTEDRKNENQFAPDRRSVGPRLLWVWVVFFALMLSSCETIISYNLAKALPKNESISEQPVEEPPPNAQQEGSAQEAVILTDNSPASLGPVSDQNSQVPELPAGPTPGDRPVPPSVVPVSAPLAGGQRFRGKVSTFWPVHDEVRNDTFDVATDGVSVFVADRSHHVIREITLANHQVQVIAGKLGVSGAADGKQGQNLLNRPRGLVSAGENLYFIDQGNHTIRKIDGHSRQITTVAGLAGASGSTDGVGAAARFFAPVGIATDGAQLFVTDGNHTVRKIEITTGLVITIAGTPNVAGYADGPGKQARFSTPSGIVAHKNDLYVADRSNHLIRKIDKSSGSVSTFAGNENGNFGENSVDGSKVQVKFFYPTGIATNLIDLFVTDAGNHTVRQIQIASARVRTLAGSAGQKGLVDAEGSLARFNWPCGISIFEKFFFVADARNHAIRKIE